MHIPRSHAKKRRRRDRQPFSEPLEHRCLLSGLSPGQVTSAYGLGAVTFTAANEAMVAGDGSGQTIALVEAYHDPTITSDLRTFDQFYGLPSPKLTVVNQAGNASDDGWALEESLDVEWAHAIAPGASLLVVEASSQTIGGLLAAVSVARSTPGVVAVSMSWGFSEFQHEADHNLMFTTPRGHTGITFLAASGDNGPAGGPEWPSVAPTVVAVGGTSLFLSDSGGYVSETPWSGSSGGYSRFEPEPAYQRAVQRTGRKSTPDVAFDGDPNTGVLVYQTSLETGRGSWETVGGTSLGTPAWAAIIAIVDQGRALAGKGSLDGATQTLPALYSLPASDFRPVTSHVRRGHVLFAAANTETGRGTPSGQNLVSGLVAADGSTRIKIRAVRARFVPGARRAAIPKIAAPIAARAVLWAYPPTDQLTAHPFLVQDSTPRL